MIKKLLLLNCFLVVVFITTSKKAHAQNNEKKEVKTSITINGGDTTVNGKKFKNLSEDEKAELRKEFIKNERRRILIDAPHFGKSLTIVKRKSSINDSLIFVVDSTRMRNFSFKTDGISPTVIDFTRDSLMRKLEGMIMDREMVKGRSLAEDIDWEMVHPRRVTPGRPNNNSGYTMTLPSPNKPNSNTFNYSTTDRDGYTTKIMYSILEPTKSDLINIFKDDNFNINELNISDVILIPNFTSGKTTLSFSTKVKGAISIKLIDSAGTTLFFDNKTLTGELYNNSFSIAKNGNYFLYITQGSQTYIRKVTLIRN